mgnify:CR=1 FL=1
MDGWMKFFSAEKKELSQWMNEWMIEREKYDWLNGEILCYFFEKICFKKLGGHQLGCIFVVVVVVFDFI